MLYATIRYYTTRFFWVALYTNTSAAEEVKHAVDVGEAGANKRSRPVKASDPPDKEGIIAFKDLPRVESPESRVGSCLSPHVSSSLSPHVSSVSPKYLPSAKYLSPHTSQAASRGSYVSALSAALESAARRSAALPPAGGVVSEFAPVDQAGHDSDALKSPQVPYSEILPYGDHITWYAVCL